MSTSLLTLLTSLESQARPLLSSGQDWRFQRLINFDKDEATLQLWEAETLTGQIEVRVARQTDGSLVCSGIVQGVANPEATRPFSFRPINPGDVERQALQIAQLWRQTLPD